MQSESVKELATALAKAQGEIKGAIKDSANPFFKSKYADLANVVEAIREPFAKNGLSYIQRVEPSDKEEIRVETVILHASGEWFGCGWLSLPVSKADAQGYGSAMTYARRYSLSAAAGVAPEDDDGNAAAKAAPKNKNKAGMEESVKADFLAAIESASTSEELQGIWKKAASVAKDAEDRSAHEILKEAAMKRAEQMKAKE